MSETSTTSITTASAAPAKPASDRPAARKPAKRRVAEPSGDVCLTASLFALKTGSIDNAKKALQELHAQHAETLRFVLDCGGFEDALERLDDLAERLHAA